MKKFKIIISDEAKESIDKYMNFYKYYYKDLFQDSGIWSSNKIIEDYIFDAKVKSEEILDLIYEKLGDNLIFYPENIAKIRWRKRILEIKFLDYNEYRFIVNIKII